MWNPNSINPFQFRTDNPGPHVLLTAGVHGDEYEPILAAAELIQELTGIVIAGSVTIVSIVNTSAYSIGSRFGEDQLDLARICPGNHGGSVSERCAAQISDLIKEANYLIDMHTGGFAFDIYPMAGFMLHSSPAILKKQQELALAYNMPVIWGTDPRPGGRTLSVARDVGVPAIYLEYGGGSTIKKEIVNTYKEGFLNVLKFLNMANGAVKNLSPGKRFWVEDSRPNSGYLQGRMPSPSYGIFVPDVIPGQQIKKNKRFGCVIDPSTNNRTEVFADMDGLVLSVRVSAQVKSGDALGSILPITEPGKIIVNDK